MHLILELLQRWLAVSHMLQYTFARDEVVPDLDQLSTAAVSRHVTLQMVHVGVT